MSYPTGPIKGMKNLKSLSPSGDLGKRDDAPMRECFPNPIKNSGGELSGSKAFGSGIGEIGKIGAKNSNGGVTA